MLLRLTLAAACAALVAGLYVIRHRVASQRLQVLIVADDCPSAVARTSIHGCQPLLYCNTCEAHCRAASYHLFPVVHGCIQALAMFLCDNRWARGMETPSGCRC